MNPVLSVEKGYDKRIQLDVAEIVAPPVNEQDLAISAASEVSFIVTITKTATTATIEKTLSDGDITFPDDNHIQFDLDSDETNFSGRRFWSLRMTLGGKKYRSREIGYLDSDVGIPVAYP